LDKYATEVLGLNIDNFLKRLYIVIRRGYDSVQPLLAALSLGRDFL